MDILVDENIPRRTVRALQELGHDVVDLRGSAAEGCSDQALWERALGERRLLITTDKGFSQYRERDHAGILIVRLRQPNRLKIHDRVMKAMKRFGTSEWRGLVVVMRDVVQSVSRRRPER